MARSHLTGTLGLNRLGIRDIVDLNRVLAEPEEHAAGLALFLFIANLDPEQAGAGLKLFYERLGVAVNEPFVQHRAD
jgi:hypothetical protein